MPTAKTLSVTSEMVSNFNALRELIVPIFLTKEEQKEIDGDKEHKGGVVREFTKLLLHELVPQIDIDRIEELLKEARKTANPNVFNKTNSEDNMVSDNANAEEMM